ncbi:MAG: phytoene/squalene synthase family protein [Aquamicrobium sp.]|uniref:phytoene/squalene synthase family protein n=1 Tax=Aquamicrobium sp. TaxID=1872579 RepID=UPI00349EC6E4|nr:phytoene/squalene synthase family protein [Aquamicrobium sp.]
MADPQGIDDSQTLRRSDPDRYLSTLYAPQAVRADLTALYLFNAEIASIRDRIREPLPGEVRIQWWRDMLAGGKPAAGGYPLAEALLDAIQRHNLPLDAFDRYLEARIFDLYDDPMPSRADLEGYCGETASAVIQLAALMLEPEAAPAFAPAAGHAGCAQAIAGLVRLMPLHRARGQCYVPGDILAAAGASRDDIAGTGESEAARRALAAFIELGREHAARFAEAAKGMPVSLRPAFLPASLAFPYLKRAAAAGAQPLRRVVDISPLRRHWTMLRFAARGWG